MNKKPILKKNIMRGLRGLLLLFFQVKVKADPIYSEKGSIMQNFPRAEQSLSNDTLLSVDTINLGDSIFLNNILSIPPDDLLIPVDTCFVD